MTDDAHYRATILGCGSSGGVPRIGGDWGDCDPSDPRNRRSRCSMLVERAKDGDFESDAVTSIVIDTAPDMRTQLLDAGVTRLDGVLYTHDHADQSHGIDDLRVFALRMRKRVPVYMDPVTAERLCDRFAYCFVQPENSLYPPILDRKDIAPGRTPVYVDGPGGVIEAHAFEQIHGSVISMGFRMENFAYSPDVAELPEESFAALEGLDLWVVDCLRYKPHRTHAHFERTLEWIDRLKPKHAILTNLHIDMDYETLKAKCPEGVEPAYDGMRLEFSPAGAG